MATEADVRRDIIDACLEMNANGLNQGTSGNISIRHEETMLISPSATPYRKLTPDMIAAMDLSGDMTGEWDGPRRPSTEWRIHWRLMNTRDDVTAIVHAHPPYSTSLAILRMPIPSCHYMIAAFGGTDVRCAGYATFGSPELSDLVIEGIQGRSACLLANHGMIAVGLGIEQAMWRAVELETIARQYYLAMRAGDPALLSRREIDDTMEMLAGYGVPDG
ncbi:MAG: class II aldolase/adducin family protein [Rhodobacter sp.]|nr:class II aldolase/adducin family protein [Rhodobacter sp.]MCY4168054.1 class II aldolase/adducin family protein [Rhodobacter sp.]MCY4243158.1 class II aldolase/adducin family protein [Rhodobacter sp.]